MRRYREAKAKHPGMLLLFRMGDFFELFDKDAETAAKLLGLSGVPFRVASSSRMTPFRADSCISSSRRKRTTVSAPAIAASLRAARRGLLAPSVPGLARVDRHQNATQRTWGTAPRHPTWGVWRQRRGGRGEGSLLLTRKSLIIRKFARTSVMRESITTDITNTSEQFGSVSAHCQVCRNASLASHKGARTMKYGMLLTSMLACAGCMTQALERHTLAQEASPTEIRYREVLDNLAMVAHDPAALPAYSSIFAGTAQITDTAQLVSTTTGGAAGAGAQVISPQYTRAALGNWTLDPINSPEKLEAIRCACRWVIYGSEFACHDCVGLLATPEQAPYPGRHFGVADRLAKLPPRWLHVGQLRDVPMKTRQKAHHGDTWVWVMPDETQALADFTLIVQDIARVDSNSPTLLFILPTPSDFAFPTAPVPVPCASGPYKDTKAAITAAVKVDPCGNLMPDNPYYRWRTENLGSDSNLRSQINAAGLR